MWITPPPTGGGGGGPLKKHPRPAWLFPKKKNNIYPKEGGTPPRRGGGGGGTPLTNTPIIAAGEGHTLAINTSGELWAWGRNDYGQLGDGTGGVFGGVSDNKKIPTRIGTATNWVSVTAGRFHNFAINSLGELYAWGNNNYGQLGLGFTNPDSPSVGALVPTRVGEATNWVNVSAGYHHSLAINTSGELWAWGRNTDGQLGDGTGGVFGDIRYDKNTPTRVGEATNWKSVTAGGYSSFAMTTDGELYAWGDNYYGQLGLGDTTDRNTPARVGIANNWSTVSAGTDSTFAINIDGELWSWGKNNSGQLGLGDTINRNAPARVGEATNWEVATSSGFLSYHTLAINSFGELYTWGHNNYGQLGLGDTTDRNTPTRVGEATNWEDVVAGENHSFAINSLGELYSWGHSLYGKLGHGGFYSIDRHEPTEVIIGSNVVAPTNITGITFSAPSATRVKIGGSYTFTATLSTGYTSPIIQLTVAGKTIAKIALVSVDNNVWTYRVYDVMDDITTSHFTRAVSRIT